MGGAFFLGATHPWVLLGCSLHSSIKLINPLGFVAQLTSQPFFDSWLCRITELRQFFSGWRIDLHAFGLHGIHTNGGGELLNGTTILPATTAAFCTTACSAGDRDWKNSSEMSRKSAP